MSAPNPETQLNRNYDVLIEKARSRIVEAIAKNMDLYGVTMSVGHLYGTMLFQDKPMTLDDMGEALGMSKTSMSTSVRTLMDLKMVNKVWTRGSRKDQYEVDRDWYQNFIDFFALKWRQAVDVNTSALLKSQLELTNLLNAHKDDMPVETQKTIENDLAIAQNALNYYDWLSRLIDSFESHKIFEYIPKNTVD